MESDGQSTSPALRQDDVESIVAQIIGDARIESLDWCVRTMTNGADGAHVGGSGVFCVSGTAHVAGRQRPWSAVLKALGGANAAGKEFTDDPAAWNYWKREILAFESGLLADLSGDLVAPRCYGITGRPHDEWHLWLEQIEETVPQWSLERHGLAARHLGQFNGSSLVRGHVQPMTPWLSRGRLHAWMVSAETLFARLEQYAASATARVWLSAQSMQRMRRMLRSHQALLAQLDRLPFCLCHHDAFRRNLLARDDAQGRAQTVAVDWAMFGYGGVGEEIGITAALALAWLEVDGALARDLDRFIFDSYVEGLADAGWHGDLRLVRFGYAATASLAIGVGWATLMGGRALQSEDGRRAVETRIGADLKVVLEQWALVQPFLLDLGEEALDLMSSLR